MSQQVTSSTLKKEGVRFTFQGKRLLADNKWETVATRRVLLKKIVKFGFYHILALTKTGTPTEYIRWGYIQLNAGDFYRTSVLTVRDLQYFLGEDNYRIDEKEEISSVGNAGRISAFNWHMSINKNEK